MFPDELEAAFQQCPIAYLPYGLCEPHGPQNTVGMDALRAHAASCLAAAAHGGNVAVVGNGCGLCRPLADAGVGRARTALRDGG